MCNLGGMGKAEKGISQNENSARLGNQNVCTRSRSHTRFVFPMLFKIFPEAELVD